MTRKALIISNPGEVGEENFCEGVAHDVTNYQRFLYGATGGFWGSSEVSHLPRPTTAELRVAIAALKSYDYGLVIFAGHGWYSTTLNSTILLLRRGQEIDLSELRRGPSRQTIILDCCREKHTGLPIVEMLTAKAAMFANTASRLNPEHCKMFYNKTIEECPAELVVTYGCSVGERAGDDDKRGGVYSYSLINHAETWSENVECDTSKQYKTLSIVAAHEQASIAVKRIRGDRQNPQIEKPRSGPYFPFCIVA